MTLPTASGIGYGSDRDRVHGEVRWMRAFGTTEADVDAFVEVVTQELSR